MTSTYRATQRYRILVAIANHGTKNRVFLDRLLREYRSMEHDVDLVVLSDAPKELGPDVEVRVGAPTPNPWSLPFAHRPLFAERAQDFDVFIYTEDDTLVTQRHVDAFLEVNALLPDDQIPGFMRYEEWPDGQRWYCSVHSSYRWLPESVAKRAGETFASFTNAHAACYMLTRDQLQRALRSGGFLVPPHEGPYDMLVSAATDPYTQCGLSRRICVSRMEDFLLHHLPNVYLGKLGVSPVEFEAQLRALQEISAGRLTPGTLLDPTTSLPTAVWDVPTHPAALSELGDGAPEGVTRALSVGCTAGRVERELLGSDCRIVAIPLDAVLGSVARTRDIETLAPDLDESMASLRGTRFPVVFLHEVLQHFTDPVGVLRQISTLLEPNGIVVATSPNLLHYRLRKLLRRQVPPLPERGYERDGVHATDANTLTRWMTAAGLQPRIAGFGAVGRSAALQRVSPRPAHRLLGERVVVTARHAF